MARETFTSDRIGPARGRSRRRWRGRCAYLSGQVGRDPATRAAGGGRRGGAGGAGAAQRDRRARGGRPHAGRRGARGRDITPNGRLRRDERGVRAGFEPPYPARTTIGVAALRSAPPWRSTSSPGERQTTPHAEERRPCRTARNRRRCSRRPRSEEPARVLPDGRGLSERAMQALAPRVSTSPRHTFVLPGDAGDGLPPADLHPRARATLRGAPTVGTASVLARWAWSRCRTARGASS